MAVLLRPLRRMRRHLILWPLLFFVMIALIVSHGCMSLLRGF
jgi:hypothetical protein